MGIALSPARLGDEQRDALKREQFLKDVLIGAVEGGTGYWAQVAGYNPDEGRAIFYEIEDFDTYEHGSTENSEAIAVNTGTIERGIQRIFADRTLVARSIREDVMLDSIENEMLRGDAETADCILQVALFGKLVYG